MDFLYLLLLIPVPFIVNHAADPAPGMGSSRTEVRSLDCRSLSQVDAHNLYPEDIPEVPARQVAGGEPNTALVCTRRILAPSERPARDEAILSTLRQSITELTQAATASTKGKPVWHVDAFYPNTQVGAKISVAARTDLVERGHRVSDRVPALTGGDVDVLSGLTGSKAYSVACQRYFSEQALSENDVLLGLMILDARETQLHAGVCQRGTWRWVR